MAGQGGAATVERSAVISDVGGQSDRSEPDDFGGKSVPSSGPIYRCTFGTYNQTSPWTDVRALSWSELAVLLTAHQYGPKEGTCIVPAVFRGTRRHKVGAQRIDVAFLDSDGGATLEEIAAAIRGRGWTAVISSTHSHLCTTTVVKRGNWQRFLQSGRDPSNAAADFLISEKGYLPRVAEGARIVDEDDEYITFEHQPCPKFRIALPLSVPWVASDYDTQDVANDAWRERLEALAGALHLDHDQACTDTSRGFFLPRRPQGGPAPETLTIDGALCNIFGLPTCPINRATPPHDPEQTGSAQAEIFDTVSDRPRTDGGAFRFTDLKTGEVLDLRRWAATYGTRFRLASALAARRPAVLTGRVADSTKVHIQCVNEDAHTQAGVDAATFVIDAGSSDSGGFVYHCRHAHCSGLDRLAFLSQMLEQHWLRTADLTDPEFLTDVMCVRPTVRIVAGEIAAAVDAAERALIVADLDIYQRGTFVVRPGLVPISIKKGRSICAQRILEVGDHALMEAMTVAADWEKYDGRCRLWVKTDAPQKVAVTYKERAGHWRLPVLTGVINGPTLRADGTVLAAPGYDPTTGLLLDTLGVVFPQVPDQPTHADAVRAIAVLTSLIDTFPFVDGPSKSVALSAILTATVRRSISTAPMHAYTAPTAGSGKSKLVDLASLISAGREAGVISQGKTEEELEKRLGALLLAGDQVIAIDNCEAPLGGEFLCTMLTQAVVRPRILGRSEAPELPSNAMVTATGNNLVLIGDMTRRAVLCRLDPNDERPELRKFDVDPIATVKADRGRFLVAALTVLRAYHVAGRPNCPDPLGSFEEWSGWVRGALIWTGQADPVETIEEARELDPKLDALVAVQSQWSTIVGDRPVSVRDLIDVATQQRAGVCEPGQAFSRQEFVNPDFREALLAVAGDGGVINSRRLGKWLAASTGRITQGLRIVRLGLSAGVIRWKLDCKSEAKHAAA